MSFSIQEAAVFIEEPQTQFQFWYSVKSDPTADINEAG